MQKFFSLLVGIGLPLTILSGCQSEQKQAESKPAPAAAAVAAPAAPAAAPAAPAKPAAPAAAAPVTATTVRVKAGASAPVKDSAGNVWLPDQGFDGGDTVERPDAPITNTKDPALYQSEH